VEEHDQRAGCLADDLVDQIERVLGALAETDERDVGPLARGDRSDVLDFDLPCDYLVIEGDDRRGDERETVRARSRSARGAGVLLVVGLRL